MRENTEESLERDVTCSVEDFNALTAPIEVEAFERTRRKASEEIPHILERTEGFGKIEPEALLAHPEALFVLRMACCPPLTKDRLSALSGVHIKRIQTLEAGELPARPSGMRKLVEEELPAMAKALSSRIDRSVAPWLLRGSSPSEEEAARAADIVSDRAAAAAGAPLLVPAVGEEVESRVRKWLEGSGYRYAEDAWSEGVPAPSGVFGGPKAAGRLFGRPSYADFVVSPKDGGGPVFLSVRASSSFANALHRRAFDDGEAAATAEAGGRYALVLCGLFDAPFVKYQAEKGKEVVWAHDLDRLEDLGL